MNWLQFIASIIGSLAWPGVVLAVLWYNRKRLVALLDWVDELTLPGGAKIKFVKAIDKASVEATRLLGSEAVLRDHFQIFPSEDLGESAPSSDLGDQFPEATVVQSFIEVVETLGKMVPFLALPTKGRDPSRSLQSLLAWATSASKA